MLALIGGVMGFSLYQMPDIHFILQNMADCIIFPVFGVILTGRSVFDAFHAIISRRTGDTTFIQLFSNSGAADSLII